MEYIYARVSTDKQETDNQLSKLVSIYPSALVIAENASGAKHRPKLEHLISIMREGDVLIVAALDRLGRRTAEVLQLLDDLHHRGIVLKSIREGVDYSTISGRLVSQIFVSFAEMERNLLSERTKAALAHKRAIGITLGRPKVFSLETRIKIQELRAQGETYERISKLTGVSRTQVYKIASAKD